MTRLRVLLLTVIAGTIVIGGSAAAARDDGTWESAAPALREWFASLRQPDRPDASCCSEADTYFADAYAADASGNVIATITDNRGHSIAVGTQVVVPRTKLNRDPNRLDHALLFVGGTTAHPVVFCFVPGSGV